MSKTLSVFRPVRSGDVQVRPFKAFKSYIVKNTDEYSGSGYRVHNALHNVYNIHVGDTSYNYPTNIIDGTNQHVIWRGINHRYYKYPYDNTKCHELTNKHTTEKHLNVSASILTLPYFDTGERIKPGSVSISSVPIGNDRHTLTDDGYGNLRDSIINTSSFASASNLMFYMSFNNEFQKFEKQSGTIYTGSVDYSLDKQELTANAYNVDINTGITNNIGNATGMSVLFTNDTSYIKVPNTKQFEQLNIANYWSLSFWVYLNDEAGNVMDSGRTLISKFASVAEQYIPPSTKVLTTRTKEYNIPVIDSTVTGWNKLRTPLHIDMYINSDPTVVLRCVIGNGTTAIRLQSAGITAQAWHHCVICNNAGTVTMYIDNVLADTDTLTISNGNTINNADLFIGNYKANGDTDNVPVKLDEIRIYNHTLNTTEISSLYGNHYLSGSLYQTNVAGNVFYRNGQIVVSSLLPKYNSGSGFFSSQWTASWKGTHTIYENEVMVRIPSDQFNHTMNPTATYRPASSVNTTTDIEKYNGSGELFKSMFTSSFVSPYITTIGLYNDNAQLLAIGKLAQPVQKRDDVDMNIIVRWDY